MARTKKGKRRNRTATRPAAQRNARARATTTAVEDGSSETITIEETSPELIPESLLDETDEDAQDVPETKDETPKAKAATKRKPTRNARSSRTSSQRNTATKSPSKTGSRKKTAEETEEPQHRRAWPVRAADGLRDVIWRRSGEAGLWSLKFLIVTIQRVAMGIVLYVAGTILVTQGYGQLVVGVAGAVGLLPQTPTIDMIALWLVPSFGAVFLLSLTAAWIGKALWMWNEKQVARVRTWLDRARGSERTTA